MEITGFKQSNKANFQPGRKSPVQYIVVHYTANKGDTAKNNADYFAREETRTSAELSSLMTSYPQVLVNAKVTNQTKNDYLTDEIIQKRITEVEKHFDGQGRVLIRPSGTEPLVRVMIEGKDQLELNRIATDLAKLIEERLA